MNTIQWILLDHGVAVLGALAWLAAGVTAALQRLRPSLLLLIAALVILTARVATVGLLARAGWPFVQEKVLFGLPLLGVAAAIAVSIAGPALLAAWHRPDAVLPAHGVTVLLTAGYAALAGTAVTILAGYRLTWATALIAIAVVGLGVLLTARVLDAGAGERPAEHDARAEPTTQPAVRPARDTPLSRRRVLSLAGGTVVVGSGVAGVGMSLLPRAAVATGGGAGRSPGHHRQSITELRGPRTPTAGGRIRRHTLTARTATVRLPSGRSVDAMTYDGQLPGPAITATQGDLIEVQLRNADIDDGVTLHWHGYDLPCGEDGAPGLTQQAVRPGDRFSYRFRADQVGTYWYHTHQASHIGVRKGLFGTLVVTPPDADVELDLTLPVHTFDGIVTVAGQDVRTDHTAAPGTAVRLRLINTDSDPHWFALTGTSFRVAAVDGRDLNGPDEVAEVALRLPAGGRYDLIFAMPEKAVGLVVDHDRGTGIRLRHHDSAGDDSVDTSRWPELDLLHYGQPQPAPIDADAADRHFTLVLDRGMAMVDGLPRFAQTVNGNGHPSIPDQLVTEGELIKLTVINRSLETHPWHLHGHPVLILSRDGQSPTGSPLWVDTFDVGPGQVWQVAFEATNPGIWMNHCHNLPHQAAGMMLQLRYTGVTTPYGGAHTGHS